MTTTPEDAHARTEAAFSAYLDGELDAAARETIDGHLAGCIQCRTRLARLRRTMAALAGLKHRAPEALLPSVKERIRRRSRGRFFRPRWLLFGRIPFEWVSLVMIVAMLLYYIVLVQGSPTGVTPAP